jgi:hypothetical protein
MLVTSGRLATTATKPLSLITEEGGFLTALFNKPSCNSVFDYTILCEAETYASPLPDQYNFS